MRTIAHYDRIILCIVFLYKAVQKLVMWKSLCNYVENRMKVASLKKILKRINVTYSVIHINWLKQFTHLIYDNNKKKSMYY